MILQCARRPLNQLKLVVSGWNFVLCLFVLLTDSLWWRYRDCSSTADCLLAVTWIHTEWLHWTAGGYLAFCGPPSIPLLPAICKGLFHIPSAELRGLFSMSFVYLHAWQYSVSYCWYCV